MENDIDVKEIIIKLSTNMVDNPDELSKYLVLLTANLWKFGRDRVEKDSIQAKKWGELRTTCDTDGQTDKLIKATDEGTNGQMATVSEKTVVELIRSLKARLKSLSDEVHAY